MAYIFEYSLFKQMTKFSFHTKILSNLYVFFILKQLFFLIFAISDILSLIIIFTQYFILLKMAIGLCVLSVFITENFSHSKLNVIMILF